MISVRMRGIPHLLLLAPLTALLLGGLSGVFVPARALTPAAARLDPRALAAAEEDGRAEVFVILAEQADVSAAYNIPDKAARTRYVYERLREVAKRTQPPLVAWLEQREAHVQRFFIANVIEVEADTATLLALAARPDVSYVELETDIELIEPVYEGADGDEMASLSPLVPDVVERGLKTIGADDVWKMGYKGEGIVVAITDTGANHRHPALKAQYRGADGDHDYDWYDAVGNSPAPVDEASHGTHVTGIAVGEAGARQIGVAPEAQWIACRMIKKRSSEGDSSLRCLQWVLAPTPVGTDPDDFGDEGRPEMAPDVVNASWGSEPGRDCAGSSAVRAAVQNLVAGGILFVASAGNSGNGCQTVCAPGTYPFTFTVANYDVRRRKIAQSSSRGPVGEMIKPDIAAPGVDINSSIPPSRYAKKSGTSMASPHVAGAVALLLSARPEFRGKPEIIRKLFEDTASPVVDRKCPPGTDAFNNNAGHGLIDVPDAVEAALTATLPPTPTNTPTLTPVPTDTPTPTTTPTPTATAVPHFEVYVPWIGRRVSLGR